MYAIIETGNKQYKISEGDVIRVEKLEGNIGDTVEIRDVLLIKKDNETMVGSPLVKEAKIVGEIVETAKGKKVIVFKFKRRKNYRRKRGHRQYYTALKINQIVG
ncbi:MAG: 50S ribosomal protein L21 [Candidatus Schekmanbacteria bacterium GWA2_38_9]|uniref:Large ribosomal subunit protein bL21 n=1 Tax=Candidatus Schekmanbacteria bacterium RIFCSPLOWO2_12_FULL_38_15 TaxID=1817883 RepID=A0A1F7SG77_9BACT|nr:MAG: 50S ribosomal protein L21 [Candidatus Schekmanbacteria bacterium GWA2_38_9]OGL49857.1 MAG: 50S ribosomal protein L21 [Candidatus Schekmanbacteria bacterium RIFCSPLOWO2_02_FULL_38_14]OGL52803.1 MAG: 50S ribosomal protein L21 [Candidatus Schekmanbacteria bacterium RIFCSPLOWO2_12_FULL_38_15]